MKKNKVFSASVTDNNLNTIKLIAALLVIVSHSFPISLGVGHFDPTYYLTKGQISLGNFSVCIFFIIAGFLIAGSVKRAVSGKEFFLKRVLRIFPLLITVIFLITFVFGPFITNLDLLHYFSNIETYKYFIRNSLLITYHNLPGAFANNVYNLSPNGALWTLPIEFLCYIGCYIAYKLNFLESKNIKYLFPLFIIAIFLQPKLALFAPNIAEAFPLILLFTYGMIFYVYKDKIPLKRSISIIFLVIILISLKLNFYYVTKILLLPYIIYYLAFGINYKFAYLNKVGKLSYGIYLWGFFIQQCICYIFGGKMFPLINAILAIPITILFAYVSNKLIENKFTRR